MTTYSFGDVVLMGFPYTDMKSVSKRPALVLFDSGDQDVLVARITTQEQTTDTDYRIVKWKEAGLLAESYVRLSKQATLEKRYVMRRLGGLDDSEMKAVRSIVKDMFLL
jgi:mRNA interferase MazF